MFNSQGLFTALLGADLEELTSIDNRALLDVLRGQSMTVRSTLNA